MNGKLDDKMISGLCLGIGAGLVHGAFLYLFMATTPTASMILYGNIYHIAVLCTCVIDLLVLLILLSSDIWLPFMMKLADEYAYYKPEE